MASLKLKFRPSATQGKEGTLFFSVIHRRITKTIHTDYHIYPHEWDEKVNFIRITGTPDRKALLQMIASKVQWNIRQLTSIITEKETSLVEYTTDDIISEYKRLPPCQTLFSFIRSMIAKKIRIGQSGTAKTYRDALNSFAHFRQQKDLTLDSLDREVISLYEAWLKGKGLKRNSSSCYLRTLRTLYHKAVEQELTTDKDVFRNVFTGFTRTTKRAISLETVRNIRRLQLPEGSMLAFSRDMFMLSLYLQGISFIDLAFLKKSDIRNGMLQYNRKKTRQNLSICWEPIMQEIVDTYAHLTHDSPYLLPIITQTDGTEREQYMKKAHTINRMLKKIGRMVGLHIPLTSYVARHTWASTMRNLGFDISIISAGLGHEDLKTTQIYLSNIDTEVAREANRKFIGTILK